MPAVHVQVHSVMHCYYVAHIGCKFFRSGLSFCRFSARTAFNFAEEYLALV